MTFAEGGIGFLHRRKLFGGQFQPRLHVLCFQLEQALKAAAHAVFLQKALDGGIAHRLAFQLKQVAERVTAFDRMLQCQRQHPLDQLRRRGLGMGFVNRRQIFQSLQAEGLKAFLALLELRAGHPTLPTGFTHTAQRFGQVQDASPVTGDFL